MKNFSYQSILLYPLHVSILTQSIFFTHIITPKVIPSTLSAISESHRLHLSSPCSSWFFQLYTLNNLPPFLPLNLTKLRRTMRNYVVLPVFFFLFSLYYYFYLFRMLPYFTNTVDHLLCISLFSDFTYHGAILIHTHYLCELCQSVQYLFKTNNSKKTIP